MPDAVEQPTDELTDRQYAIADAIELVMEAEPERSWTASELNRKLGRHGGPRDADVTELHPVLGWMVRHVFIRDDYGRGGAWTRYGPR